MMLCVKGCREIIPGPHVLIAISMNQIWARSSVLAVTERRLSPQSFPRYSENWNLAFLRAAAYSCSDPRGALESNLMNSPLCFWCSGASLHRHEHHVQALWARHLLWRREHQIPHQTRHHHPRHVGGRHHLLHGHHRKFYLKATFFSFPAAEMYQMGPCIRRSPLGRLIWSTARSSTPTRTSTSTWRRSTRWWAPFCSERLLASPWPIWLNSPSVGRGLISWPCVRRRSVWDTCRRSTVRGAFRTSQRPGNQRTGA